MMKKQIFYLRQPESDPHLVETTEPLIIFTLRIGKHILFMPELSMLIEEFYFIN